MQIDFKAYITPNTIPKLRRPENIGSSERLDLN